MKNESNAIFADIVHDPEKPQTEPAKSFYHLSEREQKWLQRNKKVFDRKFAYIISRIETRIFQDQFRRLSDGTLQKISAEESDMSRKIQIAYKSPYYREMILEYYDAKEKSMSARAS